jgi:polyvinyl alcohol dehydrogenase (cytochrome)
MSSRVRRIGARRCESKLIDPAARPVAAMLDRFFLLKPSLNASFFGASGVEREARSRSAASISIGGPEAAIWAPRTVLDIENFSIKTLSLKRLAMALSYSRLGSAILGFSLAVFAAGSFDARAQEAPAGPGNMGACPNNNDAAFADPMNKPHWNGWGVEPTQHRFQPGNMARLDPSDVVRLKLKWAFGFPGAVRSVAQPTIFGGRMFVGSQNGKVYSLDAKSGCTYWQFEAGKPVRSAVVIGPRGDGWAAYFGDAGANVYAIDALSGKILWTTKVDQHPAAIVTGAPTLVGTTLFVPVSSYEEVMGAKPSYPCCSFRGSLVALDSSTGKTLWKTFTITEEAKASAMNSAGVQQMGPSGAPIWSAPTFDAASQRVYATTGDNYSDPPNETSDAIIAFNAGSGELAWTRQITSGDAFTVACPMGVNCPKSHGPDFDFGSSAVLASLPGGKRVLVAGQKSGVVTAVDPDRGGVIVWQKRVGAGSTLGGVQWGVAADESNLYVALSDPKFHRVAPGTPGAQTLVLNPSVTLLIESKSGGGLSALRLDTGEEVWRTPHPGCGDVPGCSPAQSAAVTAIQGLVFSGGLDGHLRAYFADNGKIAWDQDTKGDYQAVNGVAAKGGSIDGGGAVVVDGMVYVGSGSGFVGTIPGNVLLAYSVDGL